MQRTRVIAGTILVASVLAPSTASADGLPVLGVDVGASGVLARAGDARYVTLSAGRSTVVAEVDARNGTVLGSAALPGAFTIPAVAYDGSAAGLAADGRSLVLITPRQMFPRPTTALRVLRTPALTTRSRIVLRGDFSFDAISPDGSRLYLIQYTSRVDPTRYAVRAYSVRRGRLIAGAIRDPSDGEEAMRGSPLTRTTSPDGRYAFTLYDGGGNAPFVHALDTQRGSARCLDLPSLAGTDVTGLRLQLTGATLTVHDAQAPILAIDTRSGRVTPASTPAPTTAAPPRASTATSSQGSPSRALLVLIAALAIVAAAIGAARRHRSRAAAVARPRTDG